jgi:hypothetical protein
MGGRAYRDVDDPPPSSAPADTRRRRRLHLSCIGVAASILVLSLTTRPTLLCLAGLQALAAYAAGVLGSLGSWSRTRVLVTVTLLAPGLSFLAAAAFWSMDHWDFEYLAQAAMFMGLVVALPSVLLGWQIAVPLRRVEMTLGPCPSLTRVPRVNTEKRAEPAALATACEEVSLEKVPDSFRPLLFTVRLRRRRLARAYSGE